jgi:hypothetical protein
MSYRRREVRDLLERLEGKPSRAVLRGLGGSNALPATRLLEKWNRMCAYCVTPVTGHHLSGEQSLTSYGNGGMLNVSLATERQARTRV